MKHLIRWLLRILYRVEVRGRKNAQNLPEKVLIISNHQSFLDAVLLAVFLPAKPVFAINTHIAQLWWVKPFLKLANTFPLDTTSPLATKALIEAVKQGKHVAIFPEGRITVTGALMKMYDGTGMVADKSGAYLLPITIEGAKYTIFSRMKGTAKRQLFPKICITIHAPEQIHLPEELKGRKRRQAASRALSYMMIEAVFKASRYEKLTLPTYLLKAAKQNGFKHIIAEDIQRKPMSYDSLFVRMFILAHRFKKQTLAKDAVGILLPNSITTLVTFFALLSIGRVPAMLNFSAGSAGLRSALRTAQIKQVYTARRFVEIARLADVVQDLKEQGAEIIYLDDMASTITVGEKLKAVGKRLFPGLSLAHALRAAGGVKPDERGVILFTSGSEGAPKAVVLSHDNIVANCKQLTAAVDFGPRDLVMNALPMFHAFGLTGGTLLPVFSGIRTFLYPSPLHYRIVPEVAYDCNATILFGTDTFLNGYARFANPYDFYRLRYIFAGAEKVQEETRKLYMEKYGVRIMEGYGSTECSPAISINTKMHYRAGSVGRILPGILWKINPIEGIEIGGEFCVSGANIMMGYYRAERPGELEVPAVASVTGWYNTGDIVTMDEDGFITIKGRMKRFAKIGGEMVSLGAVEGFVKKAWPQAEHAIISYPDAKKGEQLLLVTTQENALRTELISYVKTHGISELMLPRKIVSIDKMPVLGTGKTDYIKLKEYIAKSSVNTDTKA